MHFSNSEDNADGGGEQPGERLQASVAIVAAFTQRGDAATLLRLGCIFSNPIRVEDPDELAHLAAVDRARGADVR